MAKKEGSFTGWLQRVRRTGEYSDVLVRVGSSEFSLHMLPLLNASSYFRELPPTCSCAAESSPDSSSPGIPVVDIADLPGGAEGFAAAADFCYLVKPTFTVQNVAQIRAVADYLGMADLLESTKKFLYVNVFSHWRFSAAFLQQYKRLNSPVDEYIESRCLKVIVVACTKAFSETKYLSAPMPLASSVATGATWQSSPSQALTEIIVRMVSLPDCYVAEVVDSLVEMQINLNLKCRQGRNVRSWLDSVLADECVSDKARCWMVLCLARLLLKGAPTTRPWLELSSQYWCSLLEHMDGLMAVAEESMHDRLVSVKKLLEHRIGASLFEIDEYLHVYKFGPETLLALVLHFIKEGDSNDEALEEVADEVDGFIWNYAESIAVSTDVLVALIKAFPAQSRRSHDTLYGAIEKLLNKNSGYSQEEKQSLWRLIDRSKLSPSEYERALSNPGFLCQPHILESVLQQHSDELAKVPDGDGRNLRHIMQKVINASLKLLEENSRRSMEILELQKQYAALLGGKICPARDSCYNSPDLFRKDALGGVHSFIVGVGEETEEASSEASDTHTISAL
ncbi:hypothetical protein MPTK1_2g01120 [Marchantia polymorpha subsp. ruderalis]|uniref:Non-phototropic hypocotyl 3-like protein n=1 Tax=Marchantia polymorpha TaxID=3197 RepID=A0A1B4Z1I8_MARPO|nr:hypothetical protein MARPO_0028s0039 [Marchantia polymorpha]PTQ42718.1 hypothetical protein MARPO_0028s0039 [Marchantia polymorpha]BAV53287.1 non-phototropic hypocotyl 3-like protein [Marchantia polymorpha]BBN00678.1 hypothetical protein Mp_2g01120 [Marchantia polymorpha subsp. ruderalis]BBN00679.1 hypothetical protein Mp_2g01120 [Marchantia polymorpha subsp. ruderalis]|eukprot:PTQ42717.1 hypothetical protein MARPO_0028s0039 [Marchantia polymorpha]